ncbi:MAG TPA: FxsA family protein [Actinomycetes bacterium]
MTPVPLLLFFVFIVAPAVEIYLLVQVGQAIGFGWVLLLLIAGALLGSAVMRRAGASWWSALRANGTGSQLPDGRVAADAAMLFSAGLLIFLPGFVSDAVGLVLLLPPARRLIETAAVAWFVRRFSAVTGPGGFTVWQRTTSDPQVIKGEVIREDRPDNGEPPRGLPPSS